MIERGVIPYAPINDGAHPFDRLCATKNKERVFVAEVKTKPRRKYYPDTGINVSHFNDYKAIQNRHKIDVWLAFVDEIQGEIYGNYLEALTKPRTINHGAKRLEYPMTQNGIIYFPLEAMITISSLSIESRARLVELSSRAYEYET